MRFIQRAQAPTPAQAQACWLEVALGVFPPIPPNPPPSIKSHEKDVRSLLWELVMYACSLCGSEARKTFTERVNGCSLHPRRPLDAGNCSHASGGAPLPCDSSTYFEGEAGHLLLRWVNVLIKSWSELDSTHSQMCLTACN